MPNRIKAVEIVRQSQQGYSIKPFIVRGDDGHSYFVKGLDKSGRRALISEALGAELGKRLNLPIPEWRLMDIPDDLIGFSAIPNVTDLKGGPAFASRAVVNATDFLITHLSTTSAEQMRRVLLFDWWVQNGDRCLGEKGGNVNLIRDAQGDLAVIDHNLAFDPTFSEVDFLERHVFRERRGDFRDYVVRQEYAHILSEALSDWDTIAAVLPEDWIYTDRDLIDLTEPTLEARLKVLGLFREERFWGAL
ncbi:HipA family kinase [Pseudomonas viridiflava]|uniref:HipA family kinase n=1 Tax=Pseudomonas viridiflava TaxID=33069 RepID=UPI002EA20D67|nr:HipA family kinase [Pseudomonas viridiflava]